MAFETEFGECDEAAPAVVILGCSNGHLYKYEKDKSKGGSWNKTGDVKLDHTVTDVLQTARDRILVVQDEGYFDFVDSGPLNSVSHIRLKGLSKSSKTRLSQRGGDLAVADDNGLFFVR